MSEVNITIGLVQREIVPHDPAGNLLGTLETMHRLADQKVDMICLPELWATGLVNPTEPDFDSVVCRIDGPTIESLRDFCRETGIHLLAGSLPLKHKGKLKNTAILIGPDGNIIFSYSKIHLFGPMGEDSVFVPGDSLEAASVNGIGVGVQICYDLRFPSITRSLARAGVEIVIVPSLWPEARINHFETLLRARAIENQVFMVGINGLCSQNGHFFPGHSMIVNPVGDALNQPEMRESAVVRKLDIGKLRMMRSEICYLDDEIEINDVNWAGVVNESGG